MDISTFESGALWVIFHEKIISILCMVEELHHLKVTSGMYTIDYSLAVCIIHINLMLWKCSGFNFCDISRKQVHCALVRVFFQIANFLL